MNELDSSICWPRMTQFFVQPIKFSLVTLC